MKGRLRSAVRGQERRTDSQAVTRQSLRDLVAVHMCSESDKELKRLTDPVEDFLHSCPRETLCKSQRWGSWCLPAHYTSRTAAQVFCGRYSALDLASEVIQVELSVDRTRFHEEAPLIPLMFLFRSANQCDGGDVAQYFSPILVSSPCMTVS